MSELDSSNDATIYCVRILVDSELYEYWDDELKYPADDYDGIFIFKYGYQYDRWEC